MDTDRQSPHDPEPPGMVRCEVTGNYVAPEDSVQFQGKTVSAEGKEILLRRMLDGGAAGEKEMVRPVFFRRLLCYGLDAVLLWLVNTFILAFFVQLVISSEQAEPVAVLYSLCGVGMVFLYSTLMLGRYGQTLGKMAGGFCIVNMDGSPITFATAAVRTFWASGILAIPILLSLVSSQISSIANMVVSVFSLVNCIALVGDSDMNRALHDRLAGTRAVMNLEP